jgi:hypothetical protein
MDYALLQKEFLKNREAFNKIQNIISKQQIVSFHTEGLNMNTPSVETPNLGSPAKPCV